MNWLFALSLLLLLWKMSPGVHWLDSPELIASATSLGIGHPPGQVPYLLGVHGLQFLPLGGLAFRVSLFSVLTGFGLFYLLGRELRDEDRQPWGFAKMTLLFSFLVGVLMSPLFQSQTLRTEVYVLVAFLLFLSYRCFARKEDQRWRMTGFLFLSLAFLVHPLIAFLGLFWIPFRSINRGALIFFLVPILLLYLPIRALQVPHFNFHGPTNLEKFLWYIRSDLYKAYEAPSFGRFLANFEEIAILFLQAWTPFGVMVVFLGLIFAFKFSRNLWLRTGISVLVFASIIAWMSNFYGSNPDMLGYFLSVFVLLTFLAARAWLVNLTDLPKLFGPIGAVLALLWAVTSLSFEAHRNMHRGEKGAYLHSRALSHELPSSSRAFVASFSTYSFLSYAKTVEGIRPDIQVTYRGMGEPIPAPKRGDAWELAIQTSDRGEFKLRDEDYLAMPHLNNLERWFFLWEAESLFPRPTLLKTTESVLGAISPASEFGKEPLILRQIMNIIWARDRRDAKNEKRYREEFLLFFPDYGEELEKL